MRLHPHTTWADIHARPLAAFLPALDALRALWKLPSTDREAWARLPGGEDCAAFSLGKELVVKLVPPGSEVAVGREVSLLQRLSGALPVPIPRLLGRHDSDGWIALLLSRIRGELAGTAWPHLEEAAREVVLEELGEVAAALRRVALAPTDARPDLRARAKRHGPAAELWISRWLPPDGTPVLLHGDLTGENFLLAETGGRWRITGVLDFAGSFAGEAPIEMVSPGVFLCRGHRGRVAAFARGAELGGSPEEALAWHLLHPYSQLGRDLGMCGLPADASLEEAVGIWRR